MTNTNYDVSIFEVKDEYVNLTKIARTFGKNVRYWNRLKSTKDFLAALDKKTGVQNVHSLQNGEGELGTFVTKTVAIKFAQWISPDFEVFCIEKLNELFSTGSTSLTNSAVDKYLAMSENERAIAFFTERQRKEELQANLQLKEKVLLERTKDVPTKTYRTKINQIIRSVNHEYKYAWRTLYSEFLRRHSVNLRFRAENQGVSRLDYAEQNGHIEDLYNLALHLFIKDENRKMYEIA